MSKFDEPRELSYEEKLAACPIHQWTNVEAFLFLAQVPPRLHIPFHELVIARGELPKIIPQEKEGVFGKKAVEIINRHQVEPVEAHALKHIFHDLISQWIASGAADK